uniref:hypothetical protein n=1 Tax=Leucobacter musarum TaxID=1930747 RepID=UPI000A5E92DB
MSDRNTPSAATTPRRARRPLLVATAVAAATLCVLPAGAAFAASAPAAPAASTSAFGAAAETAALTPSETLASTPWETTS